MLQERREFPGHKRQARQGPVAEPSRADSREEAEPGPASFKLPLDRSAFRARSATALVLCRFSLDRYRSGR